MTNFPLSSRKIKKNEQAKRSIVGYVNSGPSIQVGGFLLRRLEDGSLWIENPDGEGMQVQPKSLRQFFDKNF